MIIIYLEPMITTITIEKPKTSSNQQNSELQSLGSNASLLKWQQDAESIFSKTSRLKTPGKLNIKSRLAKKAVRAHLNKSVEDNDK